MSAEDVQGKVVVDPAFDAQDETEEETTDNGFLNEAETDIFIEEEPKRELTFDEKLSELEYAVTRQSLNRDILYSTLGFCETERPLREAEEFIQARPDFKMATLSPYHLIKLLVKHHGLSEAWKDIDGNLVTPDMLEGLTEDEADDLVEDWTYTTTDVGHAFYEQHLPALRIAELMEEESIRVDTFNELLEFCSEKPRTYMEISDLLKGRDILKVRADGTKQDIQPSVFLDRLQRAGAVMWDEGWTTTEEGKIYLEER